jgi:hypothetical protein
MRLHQDREQGGILKCASLSDLMRVDWCLNWTDTNVLKAPDYNVRVEEVTYVMNCRILQLQPQKDIPPDRFYLHNKIDLKSHIIS